jgi:hypothetical protein
MRRGSAQTRSRAPYSNRTSAGCANSVTRTADWRYETDTVRWARDRRPDRLAEKTRTLRTLLSSRRLFARSLDRRATP